MEVIIQPSPEAAAQLTARIIAEEIKAKPHLVLGLATGRTMERVYAQLVAMHQGGEIDFAEVRTFNLDEYIGLAPDHPHSYRQYMEEHLFRHVNVAAENTHLPNGVARDMNTECTRYEMAIDEAGGIDFQLLGIGRSGHVGFNEPMSSLLSRTRPKALTPETIAQNAPLFPDPEQMPRRALTMGVGTILESRRALLLATGSEKAEVIAQAIEGPVRSMITASAMQMHPRCAIVLDEEAAAKLAYQDYYRWTFANEPEWEAFQ